MLYSSDLGEVAWRSVHFASPSEAKDAIDGCSAQLVVTSADVSSVHTEQQLFSCVSQALKFPGYFGGNWDALNDCLYDMDWMPAEGYVLVLEHSNGIWQRIPDTAGKFISAWLTAAEKWSKEHKPFHLVLVLS